jgi:hypothetical protein
MSGPVDVALKQAREERDYWRGMCRLVEQDLRRAQAASEGVDMLVAQAEARGLSRGWGAGFAAGRDAIATENGGEFQ